MLRGVLIVFIFSGRSLFFKSLYWNKKQNIHKLLSVDNYVMFDVTLMLCCILKIYTTLGTTYSSIGVYVETITSGGWFVDCMEILF